MIYNYINKKKLIEYVNNKREGLVIQKIFTKDIDEYINCCKNTMNSVGISKNIFLQPRIKKTLNNEYIVIFILKGNITLTTDIQNKINYWIKQMGNVVLLSNYVAEQYINL